ncbi:hypothetical protein [Roseivirga sp. E12]|uniref:hypothetical protein n=1 Tax=Roseivirga sp. E12 TaxID=2819237 RepID=UPI001ABC7A5A|nr:hypothetical protein [Roseivirga sp. E12]MBO3698923.1 hypothetical protein [Roseivirga sp. E12]
MNCLINETVDRYLRRGRKVDVIARYMRMRYRVSIEASALTKRMQLMNINY